MIWHWNRPAAPHGFDELTVRQLVSNIKVLDKDSLLICFKDGTEITQAMQRRQTA